MKANFIAAAIALCLVAAPVAANAANGIDETAMPAKKTAKKSSKKSTTKKTTATQTAQKAEAATALTKAANQEKAEETAAQEQTESKHSTGSSLLGGILGSVVGGSSSSSNSSSKGSSVISALTTIFDAAKGANKNQLVGTWTYTEPAVVFESSNTLKSIGGKVASAAIESKLQSQFEKLGIKKGAMTMTFDNDGNFSQTVSGKTVKGTYTVSSGKVSLKYGGKVQQFVGTTQVDGNDLLIVMDADKLLKFANTVGSLTGNSLLKSAGSALSSMDGMEVGLKLNK